MKIAIVDGYTDEASGLGVPPYLGTYPRYLWGMYRAQGHEVRYLTIDDVRLWKNYGGIRKGTRISEKTDIYTYNTTFNKAEEVLGRADLVVVVIGVHVPGKYLSAMPATVQEAARLLRGIRAKKMLSGPVVFGTQKQGGRKSEVRGYEHFDGVVSCDVPFGRLGEYVRESYEIVAQIPGRRVIEIETGRGCKVGKCSFCMEPIKNKFENRSKEEVLEEVRGFYARGARFFRLGKQADFYASDDPAWMLREIRERCPDIQMLHIDNVNPNSVVAEGGEEITKAIVKYGTEGNVAALGVESFDCEVIRANRLNTMPAMAFRAIEIINKYGRERGENGMPKFLPGINIIFGLMGESSRTQERNMEAFEHILSRGWGMRRINVRQVVVMPGTYLESCGALKFLLKNRKRYWKWRDDIRQRVDFPMLERIVPKGAVLRDVYAEIYDGKTTFCRQMGTYPLVIGIKGRLDIGKKYSVEVTGHMLRSITGKVVEPG